MKCKNKEISYLEYPSHVLKHYSNDSSVGEIPVVSMEDGFTIKLDVVDLTLSWWKIENVQYNTLIVYANVIFLVIVVCFFIGDKFSWKKVFKLSECQSAFILNFHMESSVIHIWVSAMSSKDGVSNCLCELRIGHEPDFNVRSSWASYIV